MPVKVSSKAIIVNSDGKFLVLNNSNMGFNTHLAYLPDFPGGTVEPGETTTDALLREVLEEIGIDISAAPRELIAEFHPRLSLNKVAVFLVWANIRDIHLDPEHCMFSWLTLAQMKAQRWRGVNESVFDAVAKRIREVDHTDYIEYKKAAIYA